MDSLIVDENGEKFSVEKKCQPCWLGPGLLFAALACILGATAIHAQTQNRPAAVSRGAVTTLRTSDDTGLSRVSAGCSDCVTAASGFSGNTLFVNGSGTLSIWNGGNGMPMETRKADKPGPTLLQVRAAAKVVSVKDSAPTGYIELARAMGVRPSAEEADLLVAIRELGYPVYDFDKVDQYLYRQALKQGTNVRWVWKPANLSSEKNLSAFGGTGVERQGVGFVFNSLYKHRVPMATMAKMRDIQAKVPSAVFLISDYEVVLPDPFLAVTTGDLLSANKIFIIDQWDEPGFGEAPKPLVMPVIGPAVVASVRLQ